MALGDLYFDVLFRDKTKEGEAAIKARLSKVGVEIGDNIAGGIQAKLKNLTANVRVNMQGLNTTALQQTINANVNLHTDTRKLVSDIQSALNAATINLPVRTQVKSAAVLQTEAQAKYINAQARMLQSQNAQALISQKTALAQARLATEHQRTAREANRARTEATRLARQQLDLQQATQRAAAAQRDFNSAVAEENSDDLFGQMTQSAQGFVALFAGGTLLSSLIRIRGEFELQLVSLRAILQSTEQANTIYSQLQSLSVISPFQLGDLVKYAKQLSAFQIPYSELYDTTKRLADLSAGVGVDMNRLILAYGQVRSAAVLRGTELRQFTEAGIPLVGLLANKFSELEGRIVSAGEVFDRISGREVPFERVREVIEDLTSEGGMAFEMQEKQAETLKGKISNLVDAYAIMMNNIGSGPVGGVIEFGVDTLRAAMSSYEGLLNIVVALASAYGAYRLSLAYKTSILGKDTQATLQNALAEKQRQAQLLQDTMLVRTLTPAENSLINTRNRLTFVDYEQLIAEGRLTAAQVKRLFIMGRISKAEFQMLAASAGMQKNFIASISNMTRLQMCMERLKLSLGGVGRAFKALGATMKAFWPMLLIGVITEAIMSLSQMGEETKRINQEIKENAEQTLKDIQNYYKSHKVTLDAIEVGTISTAEAEKAYEDMLQMYEKASLSEDLVLATTIAVEGETDAIAKAKRMKKELDALQNVIYDLKNGSIQFKINEDVLGGWLGEGLKKDVEDLDERVRKLRKLFKDLPAAFERNLSYTNGKVFKDFNEARSEVQKYINGVLPNLVGKTMEEQRIIIAKGMDVMEKEIKDYDPFTQGLFVSMYDAQLKSLDASFAHIANNLTKEQRIKIRQWNGEITDANRKEWIALANDAKRQLGLIYLSAEDIVNNISALQATINVKLNISGGEQLSNLQKTIGKHFQLTANEESWGRVIEVFEGQSSYADIEETLQKHYKELQERKARLEKTKDLNEQAQKEYNNVVADITTIESGARSMGLSVGAETKAKTKGGRTSRAKSQVDEVTKRLKEQYKSYKQLFEEYEKLKALVGHQGAIAQLKAMPGYEDLFADENIYEYIKKFLTEGGDETLIEDFLNRLGNRATKEANEFRETLQKAFRAIKTDGLTKAIDKAVDDINEALEIGIEQYKRWEDVFSQTGSKSLASFVAYGNPEAIAEDVISMRKEALRLIAGAHQRNLTYEDILGLSEVQFDGLPDDIKKAFKAVQEAIDAQRENIMGQFVDAMIEGMSIDDKVKAVQNRLKAQLKAVDALEGITLEQKKAMRNTFIAQATRDIAELTSQALELLPVWDKIFGKQLNYGQMKQGIDVAGQLLKNVQEDGKDANGRNIYTSSYIDEGGEPYSVTMTAEQLENLKEKHQELYEAMVERNPFRALKELFDLLGSEDKGGMTDEQIWKMIGEGIASVADKAANAAGALGEMFGAMGDEGLADSMGMLQQGLEGVSAIASGFAQGGIGGGILASISTAAGLVTSIFEAHDKRLERAIEASKQRVKELQDANEELERAIERSMGGAYSMGAIRKAIEVNEKWLAANKEAAELTRAALGTDTEYWQKYQQVLTETEELRKQLAEGGAVTSGLAYETLLRHKEEELEEVRKQLEAEKDKKDSDASAIADYEAEIAELEDEIRHFAEDTLDEVLGINPKEWASTLGDALVDAFAAGEDAAEAFDKSVADVMKNAVKNMASLYILEPMLENLREYLFGEDGKGGVFGSDYYLDPDELSGMKPYLDVIREQGIPAIEELYDAVNDGFGGLLDDSATKEGLSASIKGVTEDTANLLASYLNAVRADVSLIASGYPRLTVIGQSQLEQLTMIASNTMRSAVASETILKLFQSVTMATSSGKAIRV